MYMGIIGLGIGLAGVALTPFLMERNSFCKSHFILSGCYSWLTFLVAFWLIMFFYLVAFTFQTFSQGIMLHILSAYEPEYTGVYIKYQPVANIFINVLKQILFYSKVSYSVDVRIINWETLFLIELVHGTFWLVLCIRYCFPVLF